MSVIGTVLLVVILVLVAVLAARDSVATRHRCSSSDRKHRSSE